MKKFNTDRSSERGSAGLKFLFVFIVLFLIAHAGCNYVPVAYEGASFRQEMDTAVVKALGASGRVQPVEVVAAGGAALRMLGRLARARARELAVDELVQQRRPDRARLRDRDRQQRVVHASSSRGVRDAPAASVRRWARMRSRARLIRIETAPGRIPRRAATSA